MPPIRRVTRNVMHDIDGSGERNCAVVFRRRAPYHFDPLNVMKVDSIKLWNESTARRNAVDNEQEIVDFAQAQ